MSEIKDGGPAFPQPEQHGQQWIDDVRGGHYEDGYVPATNGMTLRDWFAGQAMLAYIQREIYGFELAAEMAYRNADAMLKAREVNHEL